MSLSLATHQSKLCIPRVMLWLSAQFYLLCLMACKHCLKKGIAKIIKEWAILLFFVVTFVSQLQVSNQTEFNNWANYFSDKWPRPPRSSHTCVFSADISTRGSSEGSRAQLNSISGVCCIPMGKSLTETCGRPAGVTCTAVRVHMYLRCFCDWHSLLQEVDCCDPKCWAPLVSEGWTF